MNINRVFVGLFFFLVTSISYAELASIPATYEKLPLERWFDGTVEAVKQATVSAETKGRVAEIFFDIGDTVPAGTVILSLVSNEQREALNQAEAKVSEAQAHLDAENKEYERINELYSKNVVSKSDWDKVTARLNVAKAQFGSAQAALKTAKEQLSYTEIRAPYGGIVSARHVELGEAVFPGKSLMSGFDPRYMRVHVDLPQAVTQKVRALNKARVVKDTREELLPSKIVLFPVADPTTNTVRARLELPVGNIPVYPGEFVKVSFTIGDIERLLVPSSSIIYRSEVTGVYVIKNKVPTLRQVRLGNHFGDKVEVLAGLKVGEQVATNPIAAEIMLHERK